MYSWTCVLFLYQPVIFHPSHLPSKTSISLWGLGGRDSFQQRLTVFSLLFVPLIRVSPSKVPGLHDGLLAMVHQPVVACLGKAPNLPSPACSSLHLSCYSRLMSQGSHGCVAPFPLPNRAFHWVSQGTTAHLATAMKLAPGRAPVHISWSMVQLIHYFLVCKSKKLLLSARHTSLSWVTPQPVLSLRLLSTVSASLHFLPRWC